MLQCNECVWCAAVSGAAPGRARWWAAGSAEWAGALQELFWWGAAPAAGTRELQPALLRALYHAPQHVLALLTPHDPAQLRKVTLHAPRSIIIFSLLFKILHLV